MALTHAERNMRWRNAHRDAYEATKKRHYAATQNAPNQGQRWTTEHIQMVLDHSIPDRELSKIIGRSMQSIQVLRSKLKKELV